MDQLQWGPPLNDGCYHHHEVSSNVDVVIMADTGTIHTATAALLLLLLYLCCFDPCVDWPPRVLSWAMG